MKTRLIFIVTILIFGILFPSVTSASCCQVNPAKEWRAGVARVIITPEQPIWMAGFASRDHVAEDKIQDLWAKALALQDANGRQVVLVTTDLVGIPKAVSDYVRNQLEKKYHLSRAQIILNASHTHSGPVLRDALIDIYPLDSVQLKKINQYTDKLQDQLVVLVGEALHAMKPAKLYAQNGVARFQVNRRNNNESELIRQTQLNGPNDDAVPVIKVADNAGNILAVVFGYACHNTVLSGYKWSGDYAGFAQSDLEKAYPDATALFFQGAGGDQNPLPRGTVQLAQQYGQTLAAAVESVMNGEMRELSSHISTAYKEVGLSLTNPPGKEELSKAINESTEDYQKRWAANLLEKLERGDSLRTSYPYPMEVWRLGDQTMLVLGGEVVVEYAIKLKQIFGQDIFVMGYSNDVMAYIPSTAILREGGYEGAISQMVYGLPSTWASDIETVILYNMVELARKAGVSLPESKLIDN